MKKRLFQFFLFMLFAGGAHSQDTIALKIGVCIPVHILRESDTLSYIPWGSRDTSKALKLMLYEVKYIRYAGGVIHEFQQKARSDFRQINLKLGGDLFSLQPLNNTSVTNSSFCAALEYVGKGLGTKKKLHPGIGITYVKKGGVIGAYSNSVGEYPDILHLNYLAAEASLHYYVIHYMYLKAGLNGSYLLSHSLDQPYTITQWNIPAMCYGFELGAGLKSNRKRFGLLFEILYLEDFNSLGVSTFLFPSTRNSGFIFQTGLFFNL